MFFFCKIRKGPYLGEVQKLRQDVEVLLNLKTVEQKHFYKLQTLKLPSKKLEKAKILGHLWVVFVFDNLVTIFIFKQTKKLKRWSQKNIFVFAETREKTSAVFKFNKTSTSWRSFWTSPRCRNRLFFQKGKLFLQKFFFVHFVFVFCMRKVNWKTSTKTKYT